MSTPTNNLLMQTRCQEKTPTDQSSNQDQWGRAIKVGKALIPVLFKNEEGVVMIEYAQPKRWALPKTHSSKTRQTQQPISTVEG